GPDGWAPHNECEARHSTGRTSSTGAIVWRQRVDNRSHFGAHQCPLGGGADSRRADGAPPAAFTTGAGRAHLMASVRTKPQHSGKYQGWFIDMDGRRKFFVGTRSKPETLRMAQRFEDEHRQIRLGYRPPPRPSDRHQTRPLVEVIQEYLA